MLSNLVGFLLIENVPLLLSWTFALYMAIGATIELKYRDMKTGVLFLTIFFFSFFTVGSAVYTKMGLQDAFISISIFLSSVILFISVTGVSTGIWLDRILKQKRYKDL